MTRYQLSIHAEKLPRGLIRKPNPYAVVRVSGGARDGEELGKTEIVHNTLEPDFIKVIFIETDSSINLPLTVSIYNGRDDALLAEAVFEATEVFNAPGHFMMHKAQNGARVYASVEESLKGDSQGSCTLHFRGLDIKKRGAWYNGTWPFRSFFELSRKNADHAAGVVRWNTIFRSRHITDHLNPMWDEFTLSLEELCYGDLAWPLKLTIYDHNDVSKHRVIGDFETSIQELMNRVSVRGNADRERAFEISRRAKIRRAV